MAGAGIILPLLLFVVNNLGHQCVVSIRGERGGVSFVVCSAILNETRLRVLWVYVQYEKGKVHMNWAQMNKGARIFSVALGIAILTMLMSWVDVGIATRNGLEQQGFIFLLPWIYPALKIFKNEEQKKGLSVILLFISLAGVIWYIMSKNVEMFGTTKNVSATGSHLFAVSCLVALSGITQYKPYESSTDDPPEK